jgi:hypothetical protein
VIYQKSFEAGQILSKEVRGCDETVTAMCILKVLNCTRKSVLRCELHNLKLQTLHTRTQIFLTDPTVSTKIYASELAVPNAAERVRNSNDLHAISAVPNLESPC